MIDDVDIITFNVPDYCDGFSYTITTINNFTHFRSTIELHDNNMQLIESDDYSITANLSPGDYFIRITGYTVSGEYSVTLSYPGDTLENNNNYTVASNILMGSSHDVTPSPF